MRYVIAGAGGFIGSHLAHALLALGHEVVGVDRLGEPRLQAAWNELRGQSQFVPVESDLLDVDLDATVAGASAVFNLAGRGGYLLSWESPEDFERDNVTAAIALARACSRRRVGLIHASSSSVLGARATGDENATTLPCSPYGDGKARAERALLTAESAQSTVVLRFFSVYGSRQRPEMGIHRAIDSALGGRPFHILGDGEHRRSFTHVSDAVVAMIVAAKRGRGGDIYHIGRSNTHTMKDVLSLVGRLAGHAVPVAAVPDQRGNQTVTECVGVKARRTLGFVARTSLAAGLAEQYSWQRERQIIDIRSSVAEPAQARIGEGS